MRPKLATVPRVGYAREDDGALMAFDEAQAYLHSTRNALKLAVARREIEFVRIGKQTLFTRAGLQRFIASRTAVPK